MEIYVVIAEYEIQGEYCDPRTCNIYVGIDKDIAFDIKNSEDCDGLYVQTWINGEIVSTHFLDLSTGIWNKK